MLQIRQILKIICLLSGFRQNSKEFEDKKLKFEVNIKKRKNEKQQNSPDNADPGRYGFGNSFFTGKNNCKRF